LPALAEKFRRITSTPAYRLLAEAIEQRILAGQIRPGEPIGNRIHLQAAAERGAARGT